MIKNLTSLLVITFMSCGAANFAPQDPLFRPYINQFINYYGQDTDGIEIDLVDNFTNVITTNQVGLCITDSKLQYPTISISREYWTNATEISKKVLLFHELGHCLFQRIHETEMYPDNCPKSIMYPDVLLDYCFITHQTDLLKELPLK